jgi:hypothetical protein
MSVKKDTPIQKRKSRALCSAVDHTESAEPAGKAACFLKVNIQERAVKA